MLVLCLCFALLASTSAVPASRNRGSAVSQGRQLSASPQLQPVEYEAPSNSLEPLLARQLFRHSPANAQLLSVKPALTGIISRLPDNATLLRPNIKDTFSCIGRTYGYYADPDNDCQIFHVCLPLHSLYPTLFKTQTTYHFSFICGNQTSFDQASMACVHKDSFTCDNPEMYYYLNYNFFRKVKTPEGEERWAWVNEDVPKGFAPEKPGSASVKPGSASVSVSVPVPVPTGRK
ncbi:uncharacterized protein LOC125046918 isoform X2 [Penaeus chinensis]|uniref:uncharacterized protein LOC125046918 isoform X2 n=1 Tax=Penaeus chinensis TaxID=139456 RepID=UPI001FB79182|nr:uncharacterized protein LOC125046918 isoform X2 [Penaeus chinensis]